ncbi:MAG: hypothetical protein Q8K63_15105, partial [Acidimicrobiales bacterium]|nr:hypothetical protein [Acidimicrobiales bacterium]
MPRHDMPHFRTERAPRALADVWDVRSGRKLTKLLDVTPNSNNAVPSAPTDRYTIISADCHAG